MPERFSSETFHLRRYTNALQPFTLPAGLEITRIIVIKH